MTAGSERGIKAGRAYVELGVSDKLTTALRSHAAKLKAFGSEVASAGRTLTLAGTAMLAPLGMAATKFSRMGDEVAKMAKRTGLSVETLSELRFVASQTGTDFESLEGAFRKMQRSIYDAERGLSTQTDALRDLGLSVSDLAGQSPEQQFKILANAISAVSDPTRKAALAMSLFGRTGTNLLPMMQQGAAGIEMLQRQARELGLTMSTEDAVAAEEFTDAMDRAGKAMEMGVFRVGAALAPLLQELADWISANAKRWGEWVQENRAAIVGFAKTAAGVLLVGATLTAFGKTIGAIATGMKALAFATKGAATAFAFLAVNPLVLAFAAAVAAAGLLVLALKSVHDESIRTSDAMEDAMDAGDRQRQGDQLRIRRLAQLADKERLANAEMQEASTLLKELQGQYGDLGASIDAATGRLVGFGEAQKRVNEQMRSAAEAQLKAALAEKASNIHNLNTERQSPWHRMGRGAAGGGLFRRDAADKEAQRVADVDLRLQKERAERDMIRARLRALGAGDAAAVTGQAEPTGAADLQSRIAADEDAAQRAAAQEAEWLRRLHRLRLEQIADERQRELALIDEQYEHELARAKEAAATQATLDAIAASRELARSALEQKLDAEAAGERERQEKESAEREERRRQSISESDSDRKRTIEELRIETTLEGPEKDRALLALQRQREMEQAQAAGEDTALVEQVYDLRAKLLAAQEAAASAKDRVAEAFSGSIVNASAILALQGPQDDIDRKQLAELQKIARNTAEPAAAPPVWG